MHQFWSPLRHWPDWVWEVGSPCRQIRRPVDMGQRGVRGMVLQQEQQLDILNSFRATYMPSTNIKMMGSSANKDGNMETWKCDLVNMGNQAQLGKKPRARTSDAFVWLCSACLILILFIYLSIYLCIYLFTYIYIYCICVYIYIY